MPRSTISKLILEKLSEAGKLALEGLFPKNRAEGRMWREVLGLPTGYKFSKPTFSVVLNRLRAQGFVAKTDGNRYPVWLLTNQGKNKLKSYGYFIKPAKADGVARLVVYDIPEKDRKKRDWLRYELVACGYNQLQKSVWLGYSPLPEEFVQSLKDLNLKDKIHIVSIHKKGTLTEF